MAFEAMQWQLESVEKIAEVRSAASERIKNAVIDARQGRAHAATFVVKRAIDALNDVHDRELPECRRSVRMEDDPEWRIATQATADWFEATGFQEVVVEIYELNEKQAAEKAVPGKIRVPSGFDLLRLRQ
jgi:hypothetical protein